MTRDRPIRYYKNAPTEDQRYNGIALGTRFHHTFDLPRVKALDSAFTGALADVRLFDKALTQAELKAL